MLSNIVLNELDQELEKRGLRYSRWADDFVIVVRSERAAHWVKENVIKYLEEELKLPVNEEKSQVSGIHKVTYLGFQIRRGKKAISGKSRLRSMQLKKWKIPRKFQRKMIKAGFDVGESLRIWVKMCRWQSVSRKKVKFVMNHRIY